VLCAQAYLLVYERETPPFNSAQEWEQAVLRRRTGIDLVLSHCADQEDHNMLPFTGIATKTTSLAVHVEATLPPLLRTLRDVDVVSPVVGHKLTLPSSIPAKKSPETDCLKEIELSFVSDGGCPSTEIDDNLSVFQTPTRKRSLSGQLDGLGSNNRNRLAKFDLYSHHHSPPPHILPSSPSTIVSVQQRDVTFPTAKRVRRFDNDKGVVESAPAWKSALGRLWQGVQSVIMHRRGRGVIVKGHQVWD
jgi:hypothetical protein